MIKRLPPGTLTFSACDWRRFGSWRGVGMSGTISRYSSRRSRARMCGLESKRMSSNSCKAKHKVDLGSPVDLAILLSFNLVFMFFAVSSLYFYLSLIPSIYLFAYQSIYFFLSIHLPVSLSVYLSTQLSIYLPDSLSIDLLICLSACLSLYLSIDPSICQTI